MYLKGYRLCRQPFFINFTSTVLLDAVLCFRSFGVQVLPWLVIVFTVRQEGKFDTGVRIRRHEVRVQEGRRVRE